MYFQLLGQVILCSHWRPREIAKSTLPCARRNLNWQIFDFRAWNQSIALSRRPRALPVHTGERRSLLCVSWGYVESGVVICAVKEENALVAKYSRPCSSTASLPFTGAEREQQGTGQEVPVCFLSVSRGATP